MTPRVSLLLVLLVGCGQAQADAPSDGHLTRLTLSAYYGTSVVNRIAFPADSTVCYQVDLRTLSCVYNPSAFRGPR